MFCNVDLPERYFTAEVSDAEGDVYVKRFVSCCNLILDELACDYAPLTEKRNVTVENGFAEVDALEVLSLKNVLGVSVPFNYSNGKLYCDDGKYVAVISKPHDVVGFNSNATVACSSISARTVAYGVASEYMLLVGDFEGAELWNKRFKDALSRALSKKAEKVMPCRRWW